MATNNTGTDRVAGLRYGDLTAIKHLMKCIVSLPADHFPLAQHLMEVCARLSDQESVSSREVLRDSRVCCHCSTPWCFAQYDICKSSAVAQSLSETSAESQLPGSSGVLNLNCKLCGRTTRLSLKSNDPKSSPTSVDETNTPVDSGIVPVKPLSSSAKKRKRRQTSKTAGLIVDGNMSACQTTAPSSSSSQATLSLAHRRKALQQASSVQSQTGLMSFLSQL